MVRTRDWGDTNPNTITKYYLCTLRDDPGRILCTSFTPDPWLSTAKTFITSGVHVAKPDVREGVISVSCLGIASFHCSTTTVSLRLGLATFQQHTGRFFRLPSWWSRLIELTPRDDHGWVDAVAEVGWVVKQSCEHPAKRIDLIPCPNTIF